MLLQTRSSGIIAPYRADHPRKRNHALFLRLSTPKHLSTPGSGSVLSLAFDMVFLPKVLSERFMKSFYRRSQFSDLSNMLCFRVGSRNVKVMVAEKDLKSIPGNHINVDRATSGFVFQQVGLPTRICAVVAG
jgi:hypothetical protein